MLSSITQEEREYLTLGPFFIPDLYELDLERNLAPYLHIGEKIVVEKDYVFQRAGEVTEKIFFITKGVAYEALFSKNGLEKRFLSFKNYPLGLVCISHQQPALFTFAALTKIEAYVFSYDTFLSLMQQSKDLLANVLKYLALDGRRSSGMLTQFASCSTLQKVCQVLYCYNIGRKYYPPLKQVRLTQQLIAFLAGIHRVSVANSLKELRADGYIFPDSQKLTILQPHKLKEIGFE